MNKAQLIQSLQSLIECLDKDQLVYLYNHLHADWLHIEHINGEFVKKE